jgi:RND family efflux transporter MFP subunit
MKKVVAIIIGIVVVAGMFGLMFRNKAQNQAKAKSVEIMTVVPVSVETVKKEKMDEKLSIIGTVNANAEVNFMSEVQGRVVSINFDAGQNVGKGQELVRIDDELKKAQLSSAQANYEKAKKDLDRYTQLLNEKTVNEVQFEQAKLAYATSESQFIMAKRQLSDTKVKSPINGVITTRNVEVGSFLNPGTPIAYIVDVSSLRIKLNVPEHDVFMLRVGDDVDITTDVYPNTTFKGRIKNISPKADEAHTYPVEVSLANSQATPLKAGMFARCYFNTVKRGETIVIPRAALVGSARTPQVYVIENEVAKLRSITLGEGAGDRLEVLSGLNEGDTIVTNGQINLQDNAQVKIVK